MGLLDGYLKYGGLFGAPGGITLPPPPARITRPPVPEPSRTQRIGNALGNVFGGADDARLSAEQNDAARKQALLMAGLGILGSDQTGLKAIAQGAMYGQQAGMQGREQAVAKDAQAQQMERLKHAVGSGQIDRPALERLFVAAITNGDMESAGKLSEVLKSMGGSQAGPQAPVRGSPEWLAARRAELELEREYAGPKAPIPGTPEYAAALEQRAQIAAKYRPAARTAAGSQGERQASMFKQFIPDAKEFIDKVEAAPGRVEQALSDRGIGEFTSDEQQQLQIAGSAMAEAWLRLTTGAAYNQQEFDNAYSMFVPRPGDRKPALEMKRKNRAKLTGMLKTAAGRLAGDDEAPTPTDDDPFGDL